MMIGTIAMLLYWAVHTIHTGYEPKVNRRIRANTYDLGHKDPAVQRKAQRAYYPLQTTKWALRVLGWIENILLALVTVWVLHFVVLLISVVFTKQIPSGWRAVLSV